MKKRAKPERKQASSKEQKPARPEPQGTPPEEGGQRSLEAAFPIVGIGASAGGLEALELFLGKVPEGSGMAFVIVQHLDPTHKGIMAELLQRATAMQVIQVKDRTRVQPDCVYVIPPNKDMSILHGVLHLLAPVAPRGLRLPIDFFFRSLADDRQDQSIGVILSGMGSDGTLGLRAIKEKAGVVFVQEPASAKFDGMPRSAIDAGLADVVAPVEELPGKIIAYLQHVPLIARPGLAQEDKAQSGLEKVVILLRAQTGHDFSLYKKTTVYRRIERRMGIHQIDRIATYVRFLQENPQELELLFKELLIGVTSFFRDPAAWEQLKEEVIPALLAGRPPSQALRAWVPGCSTGEEAYSLAIVFKEALEQLKPARNISLQIFATDLDRDAIEKAREGVFPANIAADVSPERLSRFFVQVERGYQVGKSIREMVIFAPQNVIMDPPFTKLDILSCRNLLIYLTPELQKKLLPLFHYSLNPGGFLFLGSAETIGDFTDLFAPLEGKARLYRRLDSALRAEPVEFPASFVSARTGRAAAEGVETGGQPPVAGGSTALAVLFPGGGAGQRQRRHPLHQRADGQIPGAGGRQGQLEHLCHGPRRAALRADRRLPEGAPAKRRGHPQEREGGDQRRGAGGGPHRPAARRAGGAAGDGDDRLYGRGHAPRNEADGQRPSAHLPATPRWRNWSGISSKPARSCRPPAKRCRPPRKNSNPPTRNCSPPTRNSSPPTRS